jgi:hypothetical protein
VTLDTVKGIEWAPAQFVGRVEVAVVGGLHSGVVPDALDGVELGGVRGKQKYFQTFSFRGEPIVDFRLLVIGGVVLYQVDSVVASVEARQEGMLQEVVEVFGLMAAGEFAARNIDAGEELLGIALAACWNLRLRITGSPCLMQCRRLAERGFVFVNDYRIFRPGFFLRSG